MIPDLSLIWMATLLAKTSLITGAGLAATRWIARRPVERVAVLRTTLALLVILPLAEAVAPALTLTVLPAAVAVDAAQAAAPLWSGRAGPVAGVEISGALLWPEPQVVLAWIWAVVGLAILARLAVGLWTLGRWTRLAEAVACPTWRQALEHLAPIRSPRLLSSRRVAGPLSWGLPPGSILIDAASLKAPDTAPAVLAHELAHLRRGDWGFLMLSRLALALYWFNPLTWALHRALAEASEEAADAEAVRHVDRQLYARALIGLAAEARASGVADGVALAMAANSQSLKKRISSLMTDATQSRRPWTVGLTIAGLAAVATPLAALDIASRTAAPVEASAEFAPSSGEVGNQQAASAAPVVQIIETPPAPPAPPSPPARLTSSTGLVSVYRTVFRSEGDRPEPPAPPAPPAPPRLGRVQAPPAPPLPPSHALAPIPPAPPAPPAYGRTVRVFENGVERPATPEDIAAAEAAREAGAAARLQARDARREAEAARVQALEARRHAEAAREVGRQARVEALRAHREARSEARSAMRIGAEVSRSGAERLRQQARRFEDPAHRAEIIEEARLRGQTVTDDQLKAMAARMATQADRMEQNAARLADHAANSGR